MNINSTVKKGFKMLKKTSMRMDSRAESTAGHIC